MKNLGSIDWRALKRYTSAQSVKDFDKFLDALPINVGYHALAAAAAAWVIAGTLLVFTATEVGRVSSFRAEMMEVSALKPPIPVLKYEPVEKTKLEDIGKRVKKIYEVVDTNANTTGEISFKASDTDYFPQFMAAISFLQSSGKNWRVKTQTMCVGAECKGSVLAATFKVEVVRLANAEKAEDTKDDKNEKKKSKDAE